MAFTDLHGLVANPQRKAITYYLHGAIRCRHVEYNQFMAFDGNDKASRLCRAQASTRCGEQAIQRIRRKTVASNGAVIFDPSFSRSTAKISARISSSVRSGCGL